MCSRATKVGNSLYGCVSVKPVGGDFPQCSTANWWERSPNSNNSNNFCNVNTNGNANNNNASNSNGLAPDFVKPEMVWVKSSSPMQGEIRPLRKEKHFP